MFPWLRKKEGKNTLNSVHVSKTVHFILVMRPKQWVKNVYVIAPLLFSLKFYDLYASISIAFAVLSFSVISSALYVFNDMCDLDADRSHPKKRNRPLASGMMTLKDSYLILVVLLGIAAISLYFGDLGNTFLFIIGSYFVLSIAYSLGLKKIPHLEIFIVASGYLLRLVAGCAAIKIQPTSWIILTSSLLALLVVTGKRRDEFRSGISVRDSFRTYTISYLDRMITVLASCSIAAYLMFVTSDYAKGTYGSEWIIVTAIFVILGILRYMEIVVSGEGAEDPIELLFKDKWLQIFILCWLLTFYIVAELVV